MKTLLVIIADRLSELIRKGEVTPGYYNPGDVFDRVHILMINDDVVDPAAVRVMVGRATLAIHTLPPPPFARTLGWRPLLLGGWADRAVALARTIQPDVVRCYANWLNAFAGAAIKRALGVPLLVSLHIDQDLDIHQRVTWRTPRLKAIWMASRAVEAVTLPQADLVLPVYECAARYARRRGARHIRVVYNSLNGAALRPKESYAVSTPPRIICVGRQFEVKDPEPIIRASRQVGAALTLVGTGPLHDHLRRVAAEVAADVTFVPATRNVELCASLASYDAFVYHSDACEISKATMEAMTVGLPVVVNRRGGAAVPELRADNCLLCDPSPSSYAAALQSLFDSEALRRDLGRRGREFAATHFAPTAMADTVAEIYRSLLNR